MYTLLYVYTHTCYIVICSFGRKQVVCIIWPACCVLVSCFVAERKTVDWNIQVPPTCLLDVDALLHTYCWMRTVYKANKDEKTSRALCIKHTKSKSYTILYKSRSDKLVYLSYSRMHHRNRLYCSNCQYTRISLRTQLFIVHT